MSFEPESDSNEEGENTERAEKYPAKNSTFYQAIPASSNLQTPAKIDVSSIELIMDKVRKCVFK